VSSLLPDEEKPKFSVTEFEVMPESYGGYELWEGQVVKKRIGTVLRSYICSRIMHAYYRFDPNKRIGEMLSGVNFYLNEFCSPAPDILFWKVERIPASDVPTAPRPDLAIEVVAGERGLEELTHRAKAYAKGGLAVVWVIQPSAKVATVYRHGQTEIETIWMGDYLDGEAVIPGFKVELARLFSEDEE
jgi:Uma2 family endonuclease